MATKKKRSKKDNTPVGEDIPRREAVSRGFQAAYDGKHRGTNPHFGELMQAWDEGWVRGNRTVSP